MVPISRALLRLAELGGYKVRKHCYISLLPLPLYSPSYLDHNTCACSQTPTRPYHLLFPERDERLRRHLYQHIQFCLSSARCQLEARIELYELTIQPLMQTSQSCKDENCHLQSTVYARYLACCLRCVKQRRHLFHLFFSRCMRAIAAWRRSQGSSQEASAPSGIESH